MLESLERLLISSAGFCLHWENPENTYSWKSVEIPFIGILTSKNQVIHSGEKHCIQNSKYYIKN